MSIEKLFQSRCVFYRIEENRRIRLLRYGVVVSEIAQRWDAEGDFLCGARDYGSPEIMICFWAGGWLAAAVHRSTPTPPLSECLI